MQFYDVSQQSLAKSGSSVVEEYIPLWMADGTYVSTTAMSASFICDGSTAMGSSSSSNTKLHSLNSNWNTSQQFAFEVTLYGSGACTAYAQLYDITASSAVSSSQVSTTSTTATVIRSGKITLIPGHQYGVTIWVSSSGSTVYLVDASLVVFGQ